jgi:hypothetical protein
MNMYITYSRNLKNKNYNVIKHKLKCILKFSINVPTYSIVYKEL